jgi:hypothetical protein
LQEFWRRRGISSFVVILREFLPHIKRIPGAKRDREGITTDELNSAGVTSSDVAALENITETFFDKGRFYESAFHVSALQNHKRFVKFVFVVDLPKENA